MASCESGPLPTSTTANLASSTDSSSTGSAESPIERTPEGIIMVERPCDTDNLAHNAPTRHYFEITRELNTISFSDKDRQLLKAIDRLQGLHYAHRSCTVAKWRLDEKVRLDVIWLMCTFEDYLQSKDWPETPKGDESRTLLDMCKFIFYSPYVKQDLEKMEEGPQKDVLMRLYHCICTRYTT
ncbi:uncharacterized protein N7498_005645 [Penicillium cinerascens]|uniref:Uncharacterized protein n=1 Tax=Penicillium cinerascens TaxID=70096 RepID=A0A9W9MNW2_9EURO|nr:uncharacterized protein N7498_005645 [Penicillium cinerascens]KAJ5204766.1 hypothetical protein N7498_005645 [Penicillium cinerascens]